MIKKATAWVILSVIPIGVLVALWCSGGFRVMLAFAGVMTGAFFVSALFVWALGAVLD